MQTCCVQGGLGEARTTRLRLQRTPHASKSLDPRIKEVLGHICQPCAIGVMLLIKQQDGAACGRDNTWPSSPTKTSYIKHLWDAGVSPQPVGQGPSGFHHPTLAFAALQPSTVNPVTPSSLCSSLSLLSLSRCSPPSAAGEPLSGYLRALIESSRRCTQAAHKHAETQEPL